MPSDLSFDFSVDDSADFSGVEEVMGATALYALLSPTNTVCIGSNSPDLLELSLKIELYEYL